MNAHAADFDESERCVERIRFPFRSVNGSESKKLRFAIATLHAQEKRTRPIISGTRPMGCEFV
jgi:hypothetical protein